MLTEELQARAKKRFRITLVCSVCKSRKVKCDRKEPCTSCIKYNTIHLCNYDDPKWMTPAGAVGKSEVHEELGELKRKLVNLEAWITKNDSHSLTATDIKVVNKEFHNLNSVIGINPILSPIEIWNLYSSIAIVRYGKFDGRSIDFLPFTFHGVLRRDPGLLDLWYSLTERREILLREKSGGIDDSRGLLFGGNVVALQECDTFGELPASKRILMKIRHYLELRAKGYKITPGGVIGGGDGSGASRVKTGRPGQNSLPGISSSPVSDDDLFLPPDNVIWNYISIFFKYIYRYIPYLDEETFTTSVERIMSSMSSGVRGRRLKGDYAVLGQLYIVLRLAYLSCIPNNSNDLNNPLLYVIGTEYIDMAKKCLNSYQFDLGIELSVVQCCLLLCIYLNLAPEDADGPDKNQFQVLTGSLVQMANSIALNREPTKYKELSTTIKMDHLRRKIWYEIRFLDLKLTIAFGNPPNVQTRYFDTMTPFYTEGCSNVLGQPGLENELLKFNDVKDTILSETKTFVDNMLNINENVKLIETAQYLSKMELLLQREFGSLSDYDEKGLKGSLNMRLFVSLRLFQQFLYYDLFLHYERENNVDYMYFYLKKVLAIITEEFIPHYYDLLGGKKHDSLSQLNENFAGELIINPWLEQLVHRSNGMIFGTILRVNFTLHKLKGQETTPFYLELLRFGRLLTSCGKLSIVGISQISDRYWFAWKLAKAHGFVLNAISKKEYYSSKDVAVQAEREKRLHLIPFSTESIIELKDWLDKSLNRYRNKGIGSLWKSVSDVSEVTNNISDERLEAVTNHTTGSISTDLYFNVDTDWNTNSLKYTNNANLQNYFGLTSSDYNAVLDLKELQDAMDVYFDINEPFYESFG